MSVVTTQFAGHEAIEVRAGTVRLMVTTSVGPRVLGLLTEDGRNHFAELPELTLDCPGSGVIHLRGGSRLWAAPEDPRVTYRPDDDPVGVEEIDDGVWNVYFGALKLGRLLERKRKIEDAYGRLYRHR